jgi:hypothetical protein
LRAFAAMPVVVFWVRLNALMAALDVSEVALGNAKPSLLLGQVDPRHGNDGHPSIGCSSNRLSEAPYGEENDRRSVPVDSERT